VETAFACLERGQVLVPLRSAEDQERIQTGQVGEVVTPDATPGGWLEARHVPRTDDTLALLAFTSGTEGKPKAVGLTHRNLADVVARLIEVMEITPEIREYVGVPVYHSFGFGRCRTVGAIGGKAFLPAGGFNPLEIATLLEKNEINAISAVPSLWRILLQAGTVTPELGKRVRWIEIGSQAMSRAEKEALKRLFPNAKIVQHYGLTEASRSTFLRLHDCPDDQLDSVGRAIGEVEVQLSEEGRIRIRGPHVTARIFQEGSSADPRDADGYLTTSDLGELQDGYLHYLGRADDVINCGGLKLPPDQLEARMREQLTKVGELCVCRVPDPMRGDGILVVVPTSHPASDAELIDAAANAAQAFGVNARGATHVMRVETLPRTQTGKVQRRQLTQQYVESRKRAAESGAPTDGARDLRSELRAIVAAVEMRDEDTFTSLGGDSLGYIQAGLAIQRHLGYLPAGWENLPISELEAMPVRKGGGGAIETSVLLRALAIFGIVLNHSGWLEGILAIDGGAWLLLIPSGYSFARFQLQRVVSKDSPWPALGTAPRIFVSAFLFISILQLWTHDYTLSTLLFYSNFIDPHAGHGASFWVINMLLQLYLISFALCSIPAARRALRDHPILSSLSVLGVAALLAKLVPRVWNTEYLYNLVPHYLGWLFAAGACLYYARAPKWRPVASVILLVFAWKLVPMDSVRVWVAAGGLVLIWLSQIRVPEWLARGLSGLASASLYIYLTHETVFHALRSFIPNMSHPGEIFLAFVVGIAVWQLFDHAWDYAARHMRRAA
jgi:acyl-coenzyme A synthetase/AMP-(fatty) acid ligase